MTTPVDKKEEARKPRRCPHCGKGKIFPDTHYCVLCEKMVYYEKITEDWTPVPTSDHHAAIQKALEESVKLQSHYAKLLNMHDGGQRVGFENGKAWIARLRETGKLPSVRSGNAAGKRTGVSAEGEVRATDEVGEWTVIDGGHCFYHLLDGGGNVLSNDFHDPQSANLVRDAHNSATAKLREQVKALEAQIEELSDKRTKP